MVVYNAKIMHIIENEHICANHIPWSYWHVMIVILSFNCVCLNVVQFFYKIFNVIIFVSPVYRLTCQEFFLYSHVIDVELVLCLCF